MSYIEVSHMQTRDWMQTAPAFGHRGVVDTILRLLETEQITRRKAVELVEAWYRLSLGQSVDDADLRAPWEAVTWGDAHVLAGERCAGVEPRGSMTDYQGAMQRQAVTRKDDAQDPDIHPAG
jgi:hypothetical protein